MKFYGFEDVGPERGEIQAAALPGYCRDDIFMVARLMQWDEIYTSFAEARAALVQRMQEVGADPELIASVKQARARDVPFYG